MAINDGISISSTESSKQIDNENAHFNRHTEQDDDISTLTMTTDNKYSSLCK